MKTKGIKDLYLPKSILIHAGYLLFCALFTPVWGLIIKAELNKSFLLTTFLIVFVTMEVVSFIAKKIFSFKTYLTRKELSGKKITQNEITRMYLIRLVLFYIIAILATTLIFAIFIVTIHLIRGYVIPDFLWIIHEIKGSLKVTIIAYLFITPVFFFIPWQQAMKREFDLREQNLIFQNETLKNQVNPHFLFNSLNTLSSLVNTEVEIAGQFIGKLSMIYRYILDNSSKVKVQLKDEVDFIRDYFYLHETRNEGKIHLNIDIEEDKYNYEILPVSLQLLIENAIKHNMATLEKPLKINIYTEGQDIVVKNNIQKMATRVVSTKIGLKNLNERVKLITGKEIMITETNGDFLVKVPLLS